MTNPAQYQDLPGTIPIFPLRNALLLPRGRLPLNIFEPRYLAMIDAALGDGRMIGMVRAREEDGETPPLYEIGCAGRITSFMETDDGRYLITLSGISRFKIERELGTTMPYRLIQPDWSDFRADLATPEPEDAELRERLLEQLVNYLDVEGLKADWDSIEDASAETIVNSIAMSCPFGPDEKQALLEAPTMSHRAETLLALMEMALAETGTPSTIEDKTSKQRLQ